MNQRYLDEERLGAARLCAERTKVASNVLALHDDYNIRPRNVRNVHTEGLAGTDVAKHVQGQSQMSVRELSGVAAAEGRRHL